MLLSISPQHCIQQCHVHSLKSAVVGVLTPRKLGNAIPQLPRELVVAFPPHRLPVLIHPVPWPRDRRESAYSFVLPTTFALLFFKTPQALLLQVCTEYLLCAKTSWNGEQNEHDPFLREITVWGLDIK